MQVAQQWCSAANMAWSTTFSVPQQARLTEQPQFPRWARSTAQKANNISVLKFTSLRKSAVLVTLFGHNTHGSLTAWHSSNSLSRVDIQLPLPGTAESAGV